MKPMVNVRIRALDGAGTVREWGRRLLAQLVQNVPEETSFCEYECQDPQCNVAKYAVCVKYASHRERIYLQVE